MPENDTKKALAEYICTDLFKWFKDERSSQLEPQMRRAYDAFRGKYDSDALQRWKATEGTGWRSRVFVRLTKQKVVTGFNQVMSVMLQNGQIPWDIQPSPVPQNFAGVALDPEEAKVRCDRMRLQIKDDFFEGNSVKTLMSAGLEGAIYGFSWIRSPVMRPFTSMQVQFGIPISEQLFYTKEMIQKYGRHSLVRQNQLRPVMENPGVWNVFWDLESPDHNQGHGIIIRDMMSKGRLMDLAELPGYDKAAIDQLIAEMSSTDKDASAGEDDDSSQGPIWKALNKRKRVIPVYSFYGRVPLKHLQKYEEQTGKSLLDPDMQYEREVEIYTVCAKGNEPYLIRKPQLNPLTYRTLYLAKWEDLPMEAAGLGIPENMEDSQMIINGLVRAMLDNKALASNLLMYWNPRYLAPGQNKTLYPGKSFEVEEGVEDVRQAMQFFSPPDNTRGIPEAIELFREFADHETGIARTMEGQVGPKNRTAYEMARMAEAGNKLVGGTLRNYDEGHIKPAVTAQYHYHMYTNPDENMKGDFRPVATGYQSYIDRAQKAQDLLQQFQLSLSHEATLRFTKILPFLREFARVNNLDPDKFYPTDQEISQQKQLDQMAQLLLPNAGGPAGAALGPADGEDIQ